VNALRVRILLFWALLETSFARPLYSEKRGVFYLRSNSLLPLHNIITPVSHRQRPYRGVPFKEENLGTRIQHYNPREDRA